MHHFQGCSTAGIECTEPLNCAAHINSLATSHPKCETKWVQNMATALKAILVSVQASISSIAKTIDKHRSLSLSRKRKADQIGLEPSTESVKAICSYAHKICYTSFALPGDKFDVCQT